MTPFIPCGLRILDIGCGSEKIFYAKQKINGIGLDPSLKSTIKEEHFELIPGRFSESINDTEPFDVITMLAVLEHVKKISFVHLLNNVPV